MNQPLIQIVYFVITLLTIQTLADSAPFCAVCSNGGAPPMRDTFLNAQCMDPGATINSILFSSYGNPSGQCPVFSRGSCDAKNSQTVLETECLGKRECIVYPNSTTFGDPCYLTEKVLAVTLTCTSGIGLAACGIVSPPVPCVSGISEGSVAILGCPAGGKIVDVSFASFGTPSGSCSTDFKLSTCHAAQSVSLVAAACVGQSSCEIDVLDSDFGDPCLSVPKHFSALLECAPSIYTIMDDVNGPIFDGIGAAFTGGSARLLMEYPLAQRSVILDYLFSPSSAPSTSFKGAALPILKLEIGGDGNLGIGCDGSEPSHVHSADEMKSPNVGRSWAGWLATEAVARNPNIKIFVSPSTWPSWLRTSGEDGPNDPYDDPEKAAEYVAKYIELFQVEFSDTKIGYVGIWAHSRSNVSSTDSRGRSYVIALRNALNGRSLQSVKIVCSDGGSWGCAELVDPTSSLYDPVISAAVGVLGNAGRPDSIQMNISTTNVEKPVWVTRYNSTYTGPQPAINSGALSVSNEWMETFVNSGGSTLSGFIFSFGLTGVFYGSPSWANGLIQASQPWSGHWFPTVSIWALAHVNLFVGTRTANAGAVWRALPVGRGSGRLTSGGLYVCFVETALGLNDWTCVIQKFTDWNEDGIVDNVGTSQRYIFDENATFSLGGASLRIPPNGAEVWKTDYAIYHPNHNFSLFQRQANVQVDSSSRSFTLLLSAVSLYTVTSVSPSLAAQGCSSPQCESLPPPPRAFGNRTLTFSSEDCPPGSPGTLLASIYGSFECVIDANIGGILRQMAQSVPIGDSFGNVSIPHAFTGDIDSTDVDVSVDVLFDDLDVSTGGSALLGIHISPWFSIKNRKINVAQAYSEATGLWMQAAVSMDGINISVTPGLDPVSLSSPISSTFLPGVSSYLNRWISLRWISRGHRVIGTIDGILTFSGEPKTNIPSTGFIGLATGSFQYRGPAFSNLVIATVNTTCDSLPEQGMFVDVEICQAGARGLSFVFVPTGEYNSSNNYYRRLQGVDALGADSGIPMPGTIENSYDAWRSACDADTTPGTAPGTFCFGFSSSGLAKLNLSDISPSLAGSTGAPTTDLYLKTLPAGQLKLAANVSLCIDATQDSSHRLILNVCDDPAKGEVRGTQMWQIEKTLTDGNVVSGVITSGRAGPFTGAGVVDIYGLVLLDLDERVNIQVQGYNGGSNQIFDFGETGLIRATHMGVCLGACRASA